ncbi:hypothetical protein [Bradyrhizobium mercantei]|uniref:hypothetical protein n=1 Tax=Bradyrhizobium mercantei TaxID=1904807 RepID=UPI00097813FC|nr:hypothetical protein [Bradyrhizobium mercantei]
MVDKSTRPQSGEPPSSAVSADINDPGFSVYRYRRSRHRDPDIGADEPVPLFLSNPANEANPANQTDFEAQPDRPVGISRAARIGISLGAATALAAVVALLFVGSAREAILSAKAALIAVSPVEARAEITEAVRRVTTKVAEVTEVADPTEESSAIASPPSRERIAAAYQEAIKGQVVAREAPAVAPIEPPPPPAPPARRLDPDDVAALLKRANGLLAIGDILSARLLLERAADAQDADAALLLARTYDPDVLGALDKRSITPDPEMARHWYRKAAGLGSQPAQQRLAQIQN